MTLEDFLHASLRFESIDILGIIPQQLRISLFRSETKE